ncbi:MAG: hypothetical protein WBO73_04530 [Gammaproteobacteria bacterium]|jgi:hypothetical protein
MKILTYTTAILMTMTATGAFAHHPAAEVVDAETYEIIEANVAESPHDDMVMDEMGSSMEQASGDAMGDAMQTAAAGVDTDAAADAAADSAATVDTIDLMENVVNNLAQ